MVLVKPVTVVQWHRRGFPPVLALVFEIGTAVSGSRSSGFDSANGVANLLWGAPRIHGELLKLSIEISQSTVTTWCEGEGRLRRPGAASCAIRPQALLQSTC